MAQGVAHGTNPPSSSHHAVILAALPIQSLLHLYHLQPWPTSCPTSSTSPSRIRSIIPCGTVPRQDEHGPMAADAPLTICNPKHSWKRSCAPTRWSTLKCCQHEKLGAKNVESAALAAAAFAARIAASRIASISIQLGETRSRRLDKRFELVVVRFLFSTLAPVVEVAPVVIFIILTEISPTRDGNRSARSRCQSCESRRMRPQRRARCHPRSLALRCREMTLLIVRVSIFFCKNAGFLDISLWMMEMTRSRVSTSSANSASDFSPLSLANRQSLLPTLRLVNVILVEEN